MLDLVVKIHQNSVLHELCLKEALLVDWTVKDALEAQIPEEVVDIVLVEEVLREVSCEVGQLVSEQMHCLFFGVSLDALLEWFMEEAQVRVVLVDDAFEYLGVFLTEHAVLEFCVGNRLTLNEVFILVVSSIQTLWVLDDNVQPHAGLNLLQNVRECARRNAFNG